MKLEKKYGRDKCRNMVGLKWNENNGLKDVVQIHCPFALDF